MQVSTNPLVTKRQACMSRRTFCSWPHRAFPRAHLRLGPANDLKQEGEKKRKRKLKSNVTHTHIGWIDTCFLGKVFQRCKPTVGTDEHTHLIEKSWKIMVNRNPERRRKETYGTSLSTPKSKIESRE